MIQLKLFRFRIMAVLAMALLCCGTVWGQKDTENIAGTVKDSSGALVAGAKVTVSDVDRGLTFTTTTSDGG